MNQNHTSNPHRYIVDESTGEIVALGLEAAVALAAFVRSQRQSNTPDAPANVAPPAQAPSVEKAAMKETSPDDDLGFTKPAAEGVANRSSSVQTVGPGSKPHAIKLGRFLLAATQEVMKQEIEKATKLQPQSIVRGFAWLREAWQSRGCDPDEVFTYRRDGRKSVYAPGPKLRELMAEIDPQPLITILMDDSPQH